jgi:tol-pal system protein YbgF
MHVAKRNLKSRLFALWGACMLASPAVQAGLFDDDEARKQIKQLAEKVEVQNKANDERFNKLDESIKNLGIIQLLNQIEALNGEIAKLRGQIEVLSNQNEQLQKRQRDFYLDIDTRLRSLEGNTVPSTGAPPSAGVAANPQTGSGVPAQNAPNSASGGASPPQAGLTPAQAAAAEAAQRERENSSYDVGTAAFRRGDWRGAVRAYTVFGSDYPQSQLAPNAMYWTSLSQFNLKEYREARTTAEALMKKFPDSSKVPDAMMLIGSVQFEMGDMGSARNTFEDIIAKYPSSDAAAKARTRLSGARAVR